MALASRAKTTGMPRPPSVPSSTTTEAHGAGQFEKRGKRRHDGGGKPEPANVGTEPSEVQLRLIVSVAVAAEMLGISDDLVYELIEREQLPCLRLGRRRLIPRRAIELLVESAMSGFQPEIVLSVLACQAPLLGHQRGADRLGGNN